LFIPDVKGMGFAFRFFLVCGLCLFGQPSFGARYFFAVDEPWLISILNANKEIWTRDGIEAEFEVTGRQKLQVSVTLPPRSYDHDRAWRQTAAAYLRFLHPLIATRVRNYASYSFLKTFDPDFDIIWHVYIGESLYGIGEGRKIKWKKGIY
jgi:hypothetical protein